jgi:hypothetical protein
VGPEANRRRLPVSWKIEHLEPEKTILIETSGAQDISMVRQMTAEVVELALRFGVTRFLKDDREADLQLTTLEIYEIPKILAELGIPRSSRIAVLMNSSSTQRRDFEFFKTRMHNEGMPEARIFVDSKEDALGWLIGKNPV